MVHIFVLGKGVTERSNMNSRPGNFFAYIQEHQEVKEFFTSAVASEDY